MKLECLLVVGLAKLGGRGITGDLEDGFIEAGSFSVGLGEDGCG